MILRPVLCIFLLFITKQGNGKSTGISQFWTDDIKVFDQIYGKTSDKELYGATLPPAIRFDIDSKNPIAIAASDKNERYLTNGKNILDTELSQEVADRYAKLFSKSVSESKPSPMQFISFSDFKPISKSTDPETYNYLKHLEKMTEKKNDKRYKNHKTESSEEDEAYKSIQDILDAHEANKSSEKDRPRDKANDSLRYSRNRNRSKVRSISGNSIKTRCISARCRNKQTHIRPYIRKIKHYTYSRR